MDIMTLIPVIGAFIIGVMLCFYGYKMLRFSLGIIGGVCGYYIAQKILESASGNISDVGRYVLIGVFTIGLAVTAWAFYEKAIFLIGALGGAFFAYSMYTGESFGTVRSIPSGMEGFKVYLVVIITGVVTGFALRFMNEIILKLFTALIGARLIALFAAFWVVRVPVLTDGIRTAEDMILHTDTIAPAMLVSGLFLITFGIWGFVCQLKRR